MKKYVVIAVLSLLPFGLKAQLSSNPHKFLGNITTDWSSEMDYDGFVFSNYWNQVTPENATKWESVEGTRGVYNWSGADNAYKYASQHGFPFKFHTLVWGSQFPGWFKTLSVRERYVAIVKWMDAVKAKYPDLPMIDVVNEAIEGHQEDTPLMKEALGGAGVTGYDWIIRAFELAYERWPNAILIYNDFNTFTWQVNEFIDLVKTLRNAGAPIDAYGCQSHDLGGMNGTDFAKVMNRIQDEVKIPMYITEYDINDANDANQKWNYQQHIPLMWEADYIAPEADWLKNYFAAYDNDPYKRLVDMARIAQQSGVIKGILLHQGESNNGETAWPQKVKTVYERLLNDLNLKAADVPLFVGETVSSAEGGCLWFAQYSGCQGS